MQKQTNKTPLHASPFVKRYFSFKKPHIVLVTFLQLVIHSYLKCHCLLLHYFWDANETGLFPPPPCT